MEFRPGDKAVVPPHGVGLIKEISTFELDGIDYQVYVIKILESGLTVRIPTGELETNGLRKVMLVDRIADVYTVLADRSTPPDKQTWNRRYREYTKKIQTGDPLEVAHVLKDLAMLRSEKTLSFGERKMYDQAHNLIVQEVAIAKDADEEEIKKEIETLFAEADKAAAKKSKKKAKKKEADSKED